MSLLEGHGSVGKILSLDRRALLDAAGDEQAVCHLQLVRAAMLQALRWEMDAASLFDLPERAADYLFAKMAHLRAEQFRVLFLTTDCRLLCEEVMWEGSIDHVAIYPREVMRRALEVGAHSLIVAHNHPSGNPTPSANDRQLTRQLASGAKWLDVPLRDHVIVGREGYFSMYGAGMI